MVINKILRLKRFPFNGLGVMTAVKNQPGIYSIINEKTGDFYIGQSTWLKRRLLQHLECLRDKKYRGYSLFGNGRMQKHFDSGHKFYFRILKTWHDDRVTEWGPSPYWAGQSEIRSLEKFFMKKYGPTYNHGCRTLNPLYLKNKINSPPELVEVP